MKEGVLTIPINRETGRLDLDGLVEKVLLRPGVCAWVACHPREAWALRRMAFDGERAHQRMTYYNQIAQNGALDAAHTEFLWKLATRYEKKGA